MQMMAGQAGGAAGSWQQRKLGDLGGKPHLPFLWSPEKGLGCNLPSEVWA